jgi:ABC-type phosphate/phosphonate transport system permease subunit
MTVHAQALKTSAWALDTALNLFQWDRVAMVLFAIFAVVIVAEIAVTYSASM